MYGCYCSSYRCYTLLDKNKTMAIGQCPTPDERCDDDQRDLVLALPVTSAVTNHTYKNVLCARCHGERHVFYWKPEFRCHYRHNSTRLVTRRLEDASDGTLLYNKTGFYARTDDHNELLCTIHLQSPVSAAALRRCGGNVTDTCPVGAPELQVRACATHAYTVFPDLPLLEWHAYRNADCALCNGVNKTGCEPSQPPLLGPPIRDTFSFLFSINEADRRVSECAKHEVYDVRVARCRDVLREWPTAQCSAGSVRLEPDEYKSTSTQDNRTVYVYKYKKKVPYVRQNSSTGSIEICVEHVPQLAAWPPLEQYLSYASKVGSAASAVSLVAHLALYTAGSWPKKLPDSCLASLSVSLLLGYTSYLTIALLIEPVPRPVCVAAALATHFGFLTAFAWMSVMSVDVCAVLHASVHKLRLTVGSRGRRFAAYSAFAWLAPAIVTALLAVLQLSPSNFHFMTEFRPDFQHTCWFRNPRALAAFFLLPTGVMLVGNYALFLGAVVLIAAPQRQVLSADSTIINCTRHRFKIYVRLSLMMGLAWAAGLATAMNDSDALWTLHITFNSLHGVFIFLAFDWKIVRALFTIRKQSSESETQTTGTTPLDAS